MHRGKAARSKHNVREVDDPIAAYEMHLQNQPQLLAKLPELRGKVLGCYCVRLGTPQPEPGREVCHAQILARYADNPPRVEYDRRYVAPPHPLLDGPPTMTLEEWWKK